MKKLLITLAAIAMLASCGGNGQQKEEQAAAPKYKVDTILLYNDIVVEEAKEVYDPNDKGMDTYAVVMGMDSHKGLAREYYRNLKLAEPVQKGLKLTLDDGSIAYVYEDYTGKKDTVRAEGLRYKYITEEQREKYLDILEKAL